MKPPIVHAILTFFKTWFLPQPSHDEQFSRVTPDNTLSSADDKSDETQQRLESAEEMERRAAREPSLENMNLHEENLAELAKAPEGAEERQSRSGNPFSRSRAE